MHPAKTQISLGIRPVWSESLLCAQRVAKDLSFLRADSKDSDQTGRMPRLIWVFTGRTCHFCRFILFFSDFSATTCVVVLITCRSASHMFSWRNEKPISGYPFLFGDMIQPYRKDANAAWMRMDRNVTKKSPHMPYPESEILDQRVCSLIRTFTFCMHNHWILRNSTTDSFGCNQTARLSRPIWDFGLSVIFTRYESCF